MPDERDEFGGVAVSDDTADEFGGVPVSEDSQDHTPEAALARFGETIPQPEGDIYNLPLVPRIGQNFREEEHKFFQGLKPPPRTVQNAYDVMKAYAGRAGGFGGTMSTSAEQMQEELAQPDQPISTGAKVASGVIGGGINLAETFTTPEGIGLMAAGGIPGVAGRVISLGFLADMLHQAPAVYQRLGDAFGRNDVRDEAEALFDAVVHGGFTAGTAHGAFRGASPTAVREWARDFVAKTPREERAQIYGTENVQPQTPPPVDRAPEVAPAMVEKTFVGDKAVEVLEINKKKKTALVREEGTDSPPDVVKLSDLETKEVPEGGEETNASEVGKTAEVYGDVRAQPGEGPREVPVEESSGGVQPQADRGVQPAEGQNREVPLTPEAEALLTQRIADNEKGVSLTPAKIEEIKTRVEAGIDPKDVGIKVNSFGSADIPGYAQVDLAELGSELSSGKTISSNPEYLNKLSDLNIPSTRELLRLKNGAYTLEEARAALDKLDTLPLSKFEGTIPEGAVPVKVQRPDGSIYEAFRTSAGDQTVPPMIAKIKPSGESGTPSLSHKPLGKGEKIIEGPKTAEEYAAAREEVSVGPGAASPSDIGAEQKSDMQELTRAIEGTASPKESISQRLANAKKAVAALPSRGKSAISRGLLRLQAIGSAIKSGLTKLPEFTNYKKILGQWNGANQIADHELRQFVKTIDRTIPKPRQEAMINWIQADGNADLLRQRAAASNPKFRKGYEDALTLTPDERTAARNISSYLDSRLQAGIDAGLLEDGVERYITQIWKRENPVSNKLAADFSTAKLQTNFKFARQRIFDSYFEGEQAGYQPANKTVSAAVAAYDQSFNRALASRAFLKALTEGKAADGRPLVEVSGTGSTVPRGQTPEAILINPKVKGSELADYRTIDHPALRKWMWRTQAPDGTPVFVKGDLLVHPEIYRHLKNVLGTSAWRQNVIGRAILGVESTLKQSMFSLSGFHQVQETLHALGHRVNPARLEKVDFSQPWQKEAVEHGLQIADYNALEKFGEGLSSGNLVNKIPLLGTKITGPYTEWLFHDYIPRLKLSMYREALARNMERYAKQLQSGKVTRDQIVENTAKQANAAFGELNYTWMGRNKTLQDSLRAFLVAPDFLEARSKFVGQAVRSHGREQLVALGLLAATQYITARILNQVMDDDPHWELKNAFSLVKGKHKYELRTIPGDIIHLFEDPHRFTTSRLSPLVRQSIEFVEGRDWRGVKRDAGEQLKDLAKVAVPISLKPYEGQRLWEAALNAFGVHEKRYTATDQIREKARDFLTSHKLGQHQLEVTDEVTYGKLRLALAGGNMSHAKDVLKELLKTHPPDKVFTAMENTAQYPFTGSQKHERQFLFSLTPKERELYHKARNEQREEFRAFKKLWYTRFEK